MEAAYLMITHRLSENFGSGDAYNYKYKILKQVSLSIHRFWNFEAEFQLVQPVGGASSSKEGT